MYWLRSINSESNWMDNQHRRIVSCYAPREGIESARSVSYTEDLVRKLYDTWTIDINILAQIVVLNKLIYVALVIIVLIVIVVLLKFLLCARYNVRTSGKYAPIDKSELCQLNH